LQVSVRTEGAATIVVGDHSVPLTPAGAGRLAGTLRLPNVEKWWPHTHGTPRLHDVRLRLDGGEIALGRTGFRSLAVDRDADGKGFALVVNGVKIFARGACWSASDLVSLAGDRGTARAVADAGARRQYEHDPRRRNDDLRKRRLLRAV
jgi:beta-mannosidase